MTINTKINGYSIICIRTSKAENRQHRDRSRAKHIRLITTNRGVKDRKMEIIYHKRMTKKNTLLSR